MNKPVRSHRKHTNTSDLVTETTAALYGWEDVWHAGEKTAVTSPTAVFYLDKRELLLIFMVPYSTY